MIKLTKRRSVRLTKETEKKSLLDIEKVQTALTATLGRVKEDFVEIAKKVIRGEPLESNGQYTHEGTQ